MRTKRRSGFTLAEMLVVVAIIGILAAILVPAVYLGLVAAKNARIAMEVANLTAAMEDYKRTTHGSEFPPNFGPNPADDLKVRAHIQAKFGKYNPGVAGVIAPPTNLDPAEALVFWLQGYGPNPKDPLAAGTRKGNFTFDETRLIDDGDGDAYKVYVPRDGQKVPYVYFRFDFYPTATYGGGATNQAGAGTCKPYKTDVAPNGYINPTTYQIICAGQDGDWGANSTDKRFPAGANYGAGDRDNITNFSEGTLGDKQG